MDDNRDEEDELLEKYGLNSNRPTTIAPTTTIHVTPNILFRGEKLVALDPGELGKGIKWDTIQPAMDISVTVSFVQSATFDFTIFGKAIL